jgi:hypothetical protein
MHRSWQVVFRGPVPTEVLTRLADDRVSCISIHDIRGRGRSATLLVRAADARTAEQAVRSSISTPGTIAAVTPLSYWVSLGVPVQEADAIDRAISEQEPELGVLALVRQEPTEGFAELMLEVFDPTGEEAAERALRLYQELRGAGGLAAADPDYVNVLAPWSGWEPGARHRGLLNRAQDLLTLGDRDLAVVVAQTACEVLVAQVIGERLDAREVGSLRLHITSQIRTYSLNDDKTRKLWNELTNDEIGRLPMWQKYRSHVARRHAVVHQGVLVSEAAASESFEAVEALIRHVEEVRGRPAAISE